MPQRKTRPKYIVVFKEEKKEKNIKTMSEVLGVKPEPRLPEFSTMMFFSPRTEEGTKPKLYQELGVAAADLEEEEIEKLNRADEVEAVVLNEERTIPPMPKRPYRPEGTVPAPAGQINPRTLAYLQGKRDAYNEILNYLTGSPQQKEQRIPPFYPLSYTCNHSWCLDLIGIPPDYSRATGKGIKVAVLDTGIDLNHPDLTPAIKKTSSFIEGETVQDSVAGHGTHCAGIITGPLCSAGNIRYGVAPDAELLIGKVLSNQGRGYDDSILDGIDWAADEGAKIISMSLGSKRLVNQPYPPHYERIAKRLLAKGVIIITASGNDSLRPGYTMPTGNPAACPSIMAVAAVDRDRNIAYFSNCRMDTIGEINISGPGVSVHSSWPGGLFSTQDGTSMATPHVAAIAALHLEKNPGLTGKDLWKILEQTAFNVGDWGGKAEEHYGAGIAQAP